MELGGLRLCEGTLLCPVCGARLEAAGRALACGNRHSFDVAREGYVNLLRKRPRGDDRLMLASRRAFLERGHYDRLSDAVSRVVGDYLLARDAAAADLGGASAVLDAGCGEGYYLGRLRAHLSTLRYPLPRCYLGLDLSRDAVSLAARKYKEAGFVVADTREKLPLARGAVRALLNVFAPRNAAEFARVVAAGGLLLVVVPTGGHLEKLRRELGLLGVEEDKPERLARAFSDGFRLVRTEALRHELDLSTEDLTDLVVMTPNRWHATERTWERLRATDGFRDHLDVALLVFERSA